MKYQRFTPSDCTDIRIRQFEFVAKTEFLFIIKFNKIKGKENGTIFISGRKDVIRPGCWMGLIKGWMGLIKVLNGLIKVLDG